MSIKRQQNWLSQQRVDVSHLRSVESSIAADFDDFTRGFITEDSPFIIRGFALVHSLSIQAENLQVQVADAALLHSTATESGTILTVNSGVSNEILNASNDKVEGSFTANTTNFVALDYARSTDDTTIDLVKFFSPDTLLEFAKQVPLARTMEYKFVITTTGFGTLLPVAKILTDASNVVQEITDSRPMLLRLGRGGATPDPFYVHPWTDNPDGPTGNGRLENLSVSLNPALTPFVGGDKEISSFKGWSDAVMSRILEIDGGPFWYSPAGSGAGSLKHLRQDAINVIATGSGRFIHSEALGGDLSWTSDIEFRWVAGPKYVTLTASAAATSIGEDQVAYLDLVRDIDISPAKLNFSNGSNTVSSVTSWTDAVAKGDWIRHKADGDEYYARILSIDLSKLFVTLEGNYQGPTASTVDAVYAQGIYASGDVQIANRTVLTNNRPEFYWLAFRETVAGSATILTAVRSSDIVTVTTSTDHGFVEGQSISISGVTDTSFNGTVELDSAPTTTTFTYNQAGVDTASANGTASARAKLYLRWGMELEQGESRQIDDQEAGESVKEYIGMQGEIDVPNYIQVSTDALEVSGSPLNNYNSVAGEDLTSRVARLTTMMSNKTQDRLIRLQEGGFATWLVVGPPANTLSWTSAFEFIVPGAQGINTNTLAIGSVELTAGEVAWVTIDRNAPAALSLTVSTVADVPIGENILIFASRASDDRVYMFDGTSLGDGDTVRIGSAGSGGTGSLELDLIQDTLTDTVMTEIFADILDNDDDIDTAKTTATYDAASESYKTVSSASLYDYESDFLPGSASNRDGAWSVTLNGAAHAVAAGILNVAAVAQEYTITRAVAQDANLTTALITLGDAKILARSKVNTFTKSGADLLPWRLSIDDGVEFCAVALKESGATRQAVLVASNDIEVGTPVDVDWLAYHDIELKKIGSQRWELFIDGVLKDSVDYNTPSGAGGATVSQRFRFKTTATENIDTDIDYIRYDARPMIVQTKTLFKPSSVLFDGSTTPQTATQVWLDNNVGAPGEVFNADLKRIAITENASQFAQYYRTETTFGRNHVLEAEIEVEFTSVTALTKWSLRIRDNFRDIAWQIRDDAGTLKLRLVNGYTQAAVTSSQDFNLLLNTRYSIKVRKIRDESVQLWLDGDLLQTINYSEWAAPAVAAQEINWGSQDLLDNYVATVYRVRYNLPGEALLASSPVQAILPLPFYDDPYASVMVSSDLENWLPVEVNPSESPLPFAGFPRDQAVGDVYFRFAFSENTKELFGYGVGYNEISSEGPETFYEKQIAIAGQTVFNIDSFQYVPGTDNLMVFENGIHLVVGTDYVETDSSRITLITPALVGEVFIFRKIQARYDANTQNELDIGRIDTALQRSFRNFVLPPTDNLGLTSGSSNNPRNVAFSDLRFLHGIERVWFDNIRIVTSERGALSLTGANARGWRPVFQPIQRGEQKVWEDRIRFEGKHWHAALSVDGQRILRNIDTSGTFANNEEYVEITFYGTSLTILTSNVGGAGVVGSATVDVEIDGGSAGSFNTATTSVPTTPTTCMANGVDRGNNWPQFHKHNVAKGLAQGIHTIRLTINNTGSNNELTVFGFDVGNTQAVRLPGRAVVNNELVEFSTAENITLPVGGLKGKRASYYYDPTTQTFKWATNVGSIEDVQTGTIAYNGGATDTVDGLTNPNTYFNVTDIRGNFVLVTGLVSGNQLITRPSTIAAGKLEFQSTTFSVPNDTFVSYGSGPLTDGEACTVELWGLGLDQGNWEDHDTLFRGVWHSFHNREGIGGLGETVVSNRHGTLNDNHTVMQIDEAVILMEGAGAGNDGHLANLFLNANGQLTLGFHGTGLTLATAGGAGVFEVYVDGVNAGTIEYNDAVTEERLATEHIEWIVCSDLPFGYHTVRFVDQATLNPNSLLSNFRILGPKAPALPNDALEIAETYLLPDDPSDLGLDDSEDELVRMSTWTERGCIRHHTLREMTLYGTGWAQNPAGGPGEQGFGRLSGAAQYDTIKYEFYGTECGIIMESAGGTSATIEVKIDGVSVFTGVAVVSGGDAKRELRFGGLSEGPHTVFVQRTNAAAGSIQPEGFSVYGRKTFAPFKSRFCGTADTSIHGNSSIIDKRVLTPSEDIVQDGELPLLQWHNPGTSVTCSDQTTYGSANFTRAGHNMLFYSKTGTVQIDASTMLGLGGGAVTAEHTVAMSMWLDGRRLDQIYAGNDEGTGLEWFSNVGTATWLSGTGFSVRIILVAGLVVNVGPGWHSLAPTLTQAGNMGAIATLHDVTITIKDVK